jgi:hypothetical protein
MVYYGCIKGTLLAGRCSNCVKLLVWSTRTKLIRKIADGSFTECIVATVILRLAGKKRIRFQIIGKRECSGGVRVGRGWA